jgi:hypothetical protein
VKPKHQLPRYDTIQRIWGLTSLFRWFRSLFRYSFVVLHVSKWALLLSQLRFLPLLEIPFTSSKVLQVTQSLIIGHPFGGPMPLANGLNRLAEGHRLVMGGRLLGRGFPLVGGTIHILKSPRLREGLQSLHQQHVEMPLLHSFSHRFLRLDEHSVCWTCHPDRHTTPVPIPGLLQQKAG